MSCPFASLKHPKGSDQPCDIRNTCVADVVRSAREETRPGRPGRSSRTSPKPTTNVAEAIHDLTGSSDSIHIRDLFPANPNSDGSHLNHPQKISSCPDPIPYSDPTLARITASDANGLHDDQNPSIG